MYKRQGTEANEAMIKMARKYGVEKYGPNRYHIVTAKDGFHGRTFGAMSATGQPGNACQVGFGPMTYGFSYAPYNDLKAFEDACTENTIAIMIEPVQGEGGVHPATKEFMEGIRKICDDNDIIMICDEIQCGMGRTGKMYAFQHYNVKPDIITTAKALGCGVPVGAFVAGEKCCDSLVPGDHGTTYGGNPLATAAVSKVFDLFEEMNILEHVNEVSNYLEEQLDKLVEQYDNVVARRGKGLMQGLVLTTPVIDTVNKAIEKGLLVISAGSDVLRMVPPLVITKENVDEMIEILSQCL